MTRRLIFNLRVVLALAFFAGFYVLAFAMIGLLVYVPYALTQYSGHVPLRLLPFSGLGVVAIVRGVFFAREPEEPPKGLEVREAEQPLLFAELRTIAARLRTSVPDRVLLQPGTDAQVAHSGGFLGLGGERILSLGVGLVSVLDVSSLRGVIAHELAHFAGGDTRLGGVLYHTRRSVIGAVIGTAGSWVSRPFLAYTKAFLRMSAAVSRAQETQADRLAVELVGGEVFADGLRDAVRAALVFDEFVRHEVEPVVEAGIMPEPLYDGFAAVLAKVPLDAWQKAEASTPHPYDSHPPLAERLSLARRQPPSSDAPDRRAARALLVDAAKVERAVEFPFFLRYRLTMPVRRSPWADLASAYHAPLLAEEARKAAEALYPLLGAGPSYAEVAHAFARKLGEDGPARLARALEPAVAEMERRDRELVTPLVVGHALGALAGAALLASGGAWRVELGERPQVELRGERHRPFVLGDEACGSSEGLEAYVAWLARLERPTD
jgi:Zn-dependent protease with chaperone function